MAETPDEGPEEVSRRDALKIGIFTAGGLAVGGALGWLGGTGSRQGEVDSLNRRLAAITSIYNLPELSANIAMLNWSLYTNYALLDEFERKFGVVVAYDETAETQDSFRDVLRTGNQAGFDILVMTDYAVQEAIQLNQLERLNHDYIPNIDLLDNTFPTPWDAAHEYSLPYLWGTTGIGWNETLLGTDGPMNTWAKLFDASPGSVLRAHSGTFTVQGDRDEAVAAAAIYLGRDVNDLSPAALSEIEALLISVKPYLADFADATTYYDGLSTDQFHASHAWSGDVLFVRETVPKPEVTYTVPNEGAHLWTDNYVIPRNAPHRDTAMAFINYMWEASNQAVLAMFRNYMIANRMALNGGPKSQAAYNASGEPFGMILPHVLTLPDINPLTDTTDNPDRGPLMQQLRARTVAENEALNTLWQNVMSA